MSNMNHQQQQYLTEEQKNFGIAMNLKERDRGRAYLNHLSQPQLDVELESQRSPQSETKNPADIDQISMRSSNSQIMQGQFNQQSRDASRGSTTENTAGGQRSSRGNSKLRKLLDNIHNSNAKNEA